MSSLLKTVFVSLSMVLGCSGSVPQKQSTPTNKTEAAWSPEVDGLSLRLELPTAHPGETIQATLKMRNSGKTTRRVYMIQNEVFRSFQSSLLLPKQLLEVSPPHGIVITEADFPEIPAGGEVSFTQSLAVPSSTSIGEHPVTWEYENKIEQWKGGAQTLDGATKSLFGGGKIPGIWLGELSTQAVLLVK